MGLLIPSRKDCPECTGVMDLDEYKMEYVCLVCGLVESVRGVQYYPVGDREALWYGEDEPDSDYNDDPDDEFTWRA